MIHTNMPRNCTVFLLPRRLIPSAIYGCQIFDSLKWPTMLVRPVKGQPRNFEANLCGSLYSTFKTSFQPYAFYKKRLQTLFIDQLVRSKATCSFKMFVFKCVCFTYNGQIDYKIIFSRFLFLHYILFWQLAMPTSTYVHT